MKKSEILIIGAGGHLGSLLVQKIHLSKFFAKIFALLRNIEIVSNALRNIVTCIDNKSLSSYVSEQIDVVMLCTKPQDAVAALQELPSSIKNKPSLFISVAASLNTSVIKECVGSNHCIARVIPNVFLEKSHSITFVSHESCCEKCKKQVLDIFADTGEILVVPEVLLNKATVLGASMPAIIAYIAKISGGYYGFRFPQYLKSILVEITIKNGFTREEAEKIIGWNLAGLKSSCMSWGNDQILDNIINQVATQKGCTRAVLDMMEDQGLKEIIQNPHKKTEVSEIIETSINAGIERLENLSLVLVS